MNHRRKVYIQYKNLTIKNAKKTDAAILTAWWNGGLVMEHAGFPKGLSIDIMKVQQSLSEDNDLVKRQLIIEFSGLPIGEMIQQRSVSRSVMSQNKI